MSGATTPRSAGEPKAMSKALLNMKFMKRAAAADSPSSATTPTQSALPEPLPKRQKLSRHQSIFVPVSDSANNRIPKTPEAASLHRFEGGETEWVLDLHLPTNDASSEDEEEDIWSHHNRTLGRQSYGGFKRKKTTLAVTNTTPADGSESGEISPLGSDDDEESTPTTPRKTQRDEDAEGRRLDRVDFSKLSGISGSAGPGAGAGGGMKNGHGHGYGGVHRDKDRHSKNHNKNYNKRKTM